MMKIRFIKDTARNGFLNMAIDEFFFNKLENDETEECFIRIYRWNPPTLSLGYHQKYEMVADEEFLKSIGFGIVRRPTGGKAVLHHHEWTYSVCGSLKEGFFKNNSLEETYEKIALALKKSLYLLGIEAELERRTKKLNINHPAPCFMVPTQKEILVKGKKVVGSAQKRGLNAFLQHGSIPIHIDYETLAKATRNSLERIEEFKRNFSSLSEFKENLTYDELALALRDGFKETFEGDFYEKELTEEELKHASKIAEEKYSKDEWNKKNF